MTMRVKEVMGHAVVAVTEDSPFADIVATMERFQVGAVAVIDADRRVLGMVSGDDLLLREAVGGGRRWPWRLPGFRRHHHPRRRAHDRVVRRGHRRVHRRDRKVTGATAGEIMTTPAITVTPGTSVREAATLMHDHHVRQLPVIDPMTGRVAGMVRRSDLLKVFES